MTLASLTFLKKVLVSLILDNDGYPNDFWLGNQNPESWQVLTSSEHPLIGWLANFP